MGEFCADARYRVFTARFIVACDTSHLQIARHSLTLDRRLLSPLRKGLCGSAPGSGAYEAVLFSELRAHARTPAGRLPAPDQRADRPEIRVSQLLDRKSTR